jgi:acetoin:2,6-dichlorophenolindophenol oxidoreductase subunit alpha
MAQAVETTIEHDNSGALQDLKQELSQESYERAYRWILLARLVDDKLAGLYRAGKIHGGVFLGRGQEALSVSIGLALRKTDIFAPLIRDGAGRLAFGESVVEAVRACLGSPLGNMRARDGNVHRGNPKQGIIPMISHLGAMIAVVNGALMARRFHGEKEVVGVTCIGDGASSTGAFHEALNQAAVEHLPLVLVIANNQYAYSTKCSKQYACKSLVDRASGYGVTGHELDGTKLHDCLATMGTAFAQARQGGGPQIVVAQLLRLCGHGEHDDAHYIDESLKKSPLGRDCLQVAEDYLLERGWADKSRIQAWREEALREVEAAVATVQREPRPDPYQEKWQALATAHLMEEHAEFQV